MLCKPVQPLKALLLKVAEAPFATNVTEVRAVQLLKQEEPMLFAVPLKVIEVMALQPSKQLFPNVFPDGQVKVTEVKLEHPLKVLLPKFLVALLRFKVVNPLQPWKAPLLLNEVKLSEVVISVIFLQF